MGFMIGTTVVKFPDPGDIYWKDGCAVYHFMAGQELVICRVRAQEIDVKLGPQPNDDARLNVVKNVSPERLIEWANASRTLGFVQEDGSVLIRIPRNT